MAAVYAFARAADDDADEMDPGAGAANLNAKRERIEQGRYDGDPVFEALGQTIREFQLPPEPFLDLISAFYQDTQKNRYETFTDVLDYCRRSADPVGRLVLMLFGYRDPERFALSDRICTALQLINFWQDIRSDYLDRDRIYIPREDLRRFDVKESELSWAGQAGAGANLKKLIDFEIRRTVPVMREGWKLIGRLPLRLKFPISLFAAGGTTILHRLRADAPRPTLNDWSCRIRMPFHFLKALTSPA